MYPVIFTQLENLRIVVIGGGAVAERRVRGLLDAGGAPVVISPRLMPGLEAWRGAGRIVHIERAYQAGDLDGAALALSCVDDPEVSAAIAEEARQRGVPLSLADDGPQSSFHTVATVRRGPLLLTASTGGASPAFARYIREDLERRFGDEYTILLRWLGQLRQDLPQGVERQSLLRRLPFGRLLSLIRAGKLDRAAALLESELDGVGARRSTASPAFQEDAV